MISVQLPLNKTIDFGSFSIVNFYQCCIHCLVKYRPSYASKKNQVFVEIKHHHSSQKLSHTTISLKCMLWYAKNALKFFKFSLKCWKAKLLYTVAILVLIFHWRRVFQHDWKLLEQHFSNMNIQNKKSI